MRNRWFIALAAIGLHISIGSVYAWSVLTRPIMADMGFYFIANNMDILVSHFNARTICGLSWLLCRKNWP